MSILDLISVPEKIFLKENDRPTLGSLAVILTNK